MKYFPPNFYIKKVIQYLEKITRKTKNFTPNNKPFTPKFFLKKSEKFYTKIKIFTRN